MGKQGSGRASMRTVKHVERGRRTRIVSILFHIGEVSPLSEVMMRLFCNRVDTYAEQFPLKEGGASYTRVGAPLTTKVIQQHLNGERTVGVYAINPKDQSCRWVCFDFDSETSGKIDLEELEKEADKLIVVLKRHDIPEQAILREFSGSKGIHVWLFFDPPIPAIAAYHLGRNAAKEAGVKCEVFPKQKQLLSEFGNLVKLPYGIHQATNQRCRIYNEKWEPVEPEYLRKVEPTIVDVKQVEEIKGRLISEDRGWMDRVVDAGVPYAGEDPPCVAKYLSGMGVTIGHRHNVLVRLVSYFLRFKGMHGVPEAVEKARHIIHEWNKHNRPPLEEDELHRDFENAVEGPYNYGCEDEYWSKYCDIRNCPLKKKQLPVLLGEFAQEEMEQAEKLLRDPALIEEFDKLSDTWIADDYPIRRTLLRTYVSTFTDDPINQSLLGRDSIGKSHDSVTVANILGSEKIWFLGGLSPTAFIYDYGEYDAAKRAYIVDLNGVTMLFLDAPNLETWAKLRPILSHDKHEIMFRVTQKTSKGTLKTMRCIVRGWPAVVECAAQTGHASGEYSSRFLTTTPEISKAKTAKGIKKILEKAAQPELYRFDTQQARLWAAAYKILEEEAPIKIRIPFAAALSEHVKVRGPETMRFISMLVRLVKANAALHIRQRKRDEDGYLLAEPRDLLQVLDDFEKIAATSFFGVSGDALLLYNNVKGKTDLTYEAIEDAARETFGAESSETTIRKLYIKRLVETGLLREKTDPMDKRRTIYDASAKPADIAVFDDKEAVLKIIVEQGVPESTSAKSSVPVPPALLLSESETAKIQGLWGNLSTSLPGKLPDKTPLKVTKQEEGQPVRLDQEKLETGTDETVSRNSVHVDQLAQPAQTEKEDLILARGLGVKDVCGVCFKKTYANHEGTYCHRLGIVSKGLCHDCGQNKAQIRVQITVT